MPISATSAPSTLKSLEKLAKQSPQKAAAELRKAETALLKTGNTRAAAAIRAVLTDKTGTLVERLAEHAKALGAALPHVAVIPVRADTLGWQTDDGTLAQAKKLIAGSGFLERLPPFVLKQKPELERASLSLEGVSGVRFKLGAFYVSLTHGGQTGERLSLTAGLYENRLKPAGPFRTLPANVEVTRELQKLFGVALDKATQSAEVDRFAASRIAYQLASAAAGP